eukprot:s1504_g3.t1
MSMQVVVQQDVARHQPRRLYSTTRVRVAQGLMPLRHSPRRCCCILVANRRCGLVRLVPDLRRTSMEGRATRRRTRRRTRRGEQREEKEDGKVEGGSRGRRGRRRRREEEEKEEDQEESKKEKEWKRKKGQKKKKRTTMKRKRKRKKRKKRRKGKRQKPRSIHIGNSTCVAKVGTELIRCDVRRQIGYKDRPATCDQRTGLLQFRHLGRVGRRVENFLSEEAGSIEDSSARRTRIGEAGDCGEAEVARWLGRGRQNVGQETKRWVREYKVARPRDCGEADAGKQAVARPAEIAEKAEDQRQDDVEWRGRVTVARPIQTYGGCGEADKSLAQENTGHGQCGEAEKEVAAA